MGFALWFVFLARLPGEPGFGTYNFFFNLWDGDVMFFN